MPSLCNSWNFGPLLSLPAAAFGGKRRVQEEPACCRDVENSTQLETASACLLAAEGNRCASVPASAVSCSFPRANPASETLLSFFISPKGQRQTENLPGTEHRICFVTVTKQIDQNTGGEARKVSSQGQCGWSSPSSLYLTSQRSPAERGEGRDLL